MIKKDKFMINTEWEQMNKNNMKIWVSKEIKEDSVILVVLEILEVSLVVKDKKDLKIYLMDLKNLYLEIKVNQIVLKEEKTLFYIWKLILWKLLMEL